MTHPSHMRRLQPILRARVFLSFVVFKMGTVQPGRQVESVLAILFSADWLTLRQWPTASKQTWKTTGPSPRPAQARAVQISGAVDVSFMQPSLSVLCFITITPST